MSRCFRTSKAFSILSPVIDRQGETSFKVKEANHSLKGGKR